jgi:hypothetical protein
MSDSYTPPHRSMTVAEPTDVFVTGYEYTVDANGSGNDQN